MCSQRPRRWVTTGGNIHEENMQGPHRTAPPALWGTTKLVSFIRSNHLLETHKAHSEQKLRPLCAGAGGRDGGGVCAADAGGVRPAGAADGEWQAAAGGAGGGAGLPGTGAEPGRPRHGGPAAAVHPTGAAPVLCESCDATAMQQSDQTPDDVL